MDGKRDKSTRIHQFERDESASLGNIPNTCPEGKETARIISDMARVSDTTGWHDS